MKTVQLPVYRFIDNLADNLNKEVSKAHQNILHTSVLVEANSYAAKNHPEPSESTLVPYMNSLSGRYLALKKDISLKLKGGYQKISGAVSVTTLNDKLGTAKEALKKESDKCQNLQSDKNRKAITNRHVGYKKAEGLLLLFGTAESLLTVSCFLKMGDIVLIAAFVGCIIGLAQVYAAKTTVLAIREIDDVAKRKKYYLAALIGFSIFSLLLGLLRYYFAHQGAASAAPFIVLNPFVFAAFNMMLIVASALLVYHYFPSKAEIAELEHINDIDRKIKQSLAAQTALQKEYDKLLAERVLVTTLHSQIMHDQQKLFDKIDNFYLEAEGTFKNENISKRTDNAFPLCFKNPHQPLPNTDVDYLQITEQTKQYEITN